MLEVKNLTVQYGSLKIVDDVSLTVGPRQWVMLVGPNGAGKSTVISAIAQGVPYTGTVLYGGADVAKMKPKQAAKCFGVLTQNHAVGYAFTVEEIVRLGRYAFSGGMFSAKNAEDTEKVNEALRLTGMEDFRHQSVLTLSGGELQRTFLAQLLAQDPELLILDEPTNHLDLVYQKQIFELITGWIDRTGRSVLSVVHDINLAKAFGTHAVLMDRGRVISAGDTGSVLTAGNLEKVYAMDVSAWMRRMLGHWS
jgi:iron complex transport system ATP-binding protein